MESYTKHIDDVSVSLTYTQTEEDIECVIEFRNTSKKPITINPTSKNTDTHLFVGYIQLFGYVVLNYGFGLDDKSHLAQMDGPRNNTWWANKEYVQNYVDPDADVFDRLEKLTSVPFIYENSVDQLVVGGRLGGVGDLVLEEGKTIDSKTRYLLNDLIYNFNTYKPPADDNANNEDGTVPLKDLTSNILPFYTTSQSLLFTDLSLSSGQVKRFKVKFGAVSGPPTYNAFSTGITAEQGLISIKYSVILGFQKLDIGQLKPMAIYYPLIVKGERKGRDERWLQEDYLQKVVIDKSWKAETSAIGANDSKVNGKEKEPEQHDQLDKSDDDKLDSTSFFQDLDLLIDSDLQHIPRVSTTERRKSVNSIIDTEGLIPQLPSHLKNQYNFLMNNHQLCRIMFSRGYYHRGEDLMFNIELNTDTSVVNKIIGISAHIEAHEVFHMKNGENYTNVYGVSPTIKLNTLAPTMLNTQINTFEQEISTVGGTISVPRHITHQFQCSKLMSLKYFIVFKFNLMTFDKDGTNGDKRGRESNADSNSNDVNGIDENLDNGSNPAETSDLITSPDFPSDTYLFSQLYWYDNYGSQFTFRLPIVILP